MRERRHLLKGLRLVGGIVVLFLLVRGTDRGIAFGVLSSLSPTEILKTVGLFLVASLLLGSCLLLMITLPMSYSVAKRVLQAHLAGTLLSNVTPARSGYFATPLLIERLAGVPKETGFAALAGMQAVSLITKASLAALGVLVLGYRAQDHLRTLEVTRYALAGSTLLVGVGIVFAIATWTPLADLTIHGLRRRRRRPGIESLLRLGDSWLEKFRAGGRVGYLRISFAVALSAASTIVAGLAFSLIAHSVGLRGLTPFDIVMASVVVGPMVYLPIAPAGLGVVEAAYVLVLTALGQSQSLALTFALAGRLLFNGTDIIGLPWLIEALRSESPVGARTPHTLARHYPAARGVLR
jgi:uncharacterized membrane protein YbhN (UPF0104 family)